MSWWSDLWCPRDDGDRDAALSDIQADAAATRLAVNTALRKIDQLSKEVQIMGAREDAAFARQEELIGLVKEGSAAKDAKIAALEAELANADAAAQARVDAALEADSEFDAGKIEAGNSALEELVAPAPEPEQ